MVKRCRICLKADDDLIVPCNCKVNFAFVHTKCLSQWLEATLDDACDICKFKFICNKEPKSFKQWLMSEEDERSDIITMTILSVMIIYILALGCTFNYYTLNIVNVIFSDLMWSLTVIICIFFISWLAHFVQRKFDSFMNWREYNFNITVSENTERRLDLFSIIENNFSS
ncbi:E3 ubiquitin-protein ligase MARCH3-like isoform X3 [Dinothrombium tinctorium]|uniref:E3 ubiquitin-protein ligase MARCH3-like isoform X3 n=1 Tax=Dinothrombium tinctorium TaxID=1965070 RepID=A0A3S3NZ66_9ACAR|nr:E3 ubiquitin-protein ligase MARCH3-like isoform X3 [Dinothrombium tinctorium]